MVEPSSVNACHCGWKWDGGGDEDGQRVCSGDGRGEVRVRAGRALSRWNMFQVLLARIGGTICPIHSLKEAERRHRVACER